MAYTVGSNFHLIDIDSVMDDTPDANIEAAKAIASTIEPHTWGNTATLDIIQYSALYYNLLDRSAEQQTVLLAYRIAAENNPEIEMLPAFVVNSRTHDDLRNSKCTRCPENEQRLIKQRNLLRAISAEVQPTEVEVQPTCTLVSSTPVTIDDAQLTLYIVMVEGTLLSRISSNKYSQDTLNTTCKYVGVKEFIEAGWSKVG